MRSTGTISKDSSFSTKASTLVHKTDLSAEPVAIIAGRTVFCIVLFTVRTSSDRATRAFASVFFADLSSKSISQIAARTVLFAHHAGGTISMCTTATAAFVDSTELISERKPSITAGADLGAIGWAVSGGNHISIRAHTDISNFKVHADEWR
jgi:hypothetical protein